MIFRADRRQLRTALLISTVLAVPGVAHAQAAAPVQSADAGPAANTGVEEIVVTASKRAESLQNVPISIQALSTAKLEQLKVTSFNDYAKYLPSLSFQSVGPGTAKVYFRGVATGGDGNHSGPLPSVGIYLDEQPITTIQGALDIHVYDIARVEALAGPQGTLYGASSEAGTVRIITNQPDPSKFSASYNFEANTVAQGSLGYIAEGYVNQPLGHHAAIRLVGWYQKDAGYIDNVPGTRTYPSSGITIDNSRIAQHDYNGTETFGGRAALRLELGDSWTVTPTAMGQIQKTRGVFGFDPNIGDLQVTHFYPERSRDAWYQAGATIEGKVADFDIVYAGSYLQRAFDSQTDYSDYSFFYDKQGGYGAYIHDTAGNLINPSQHITGHDRFSKMSHELRVSTPTDKRIRAIVGAFYQRQTHNIEQNYLIDGLGTDLTVTGHPDTYWLTKQYRVDRDYAVFGQAEFDIVKGLKLIGGGRYYKYKNTLAGFYGFGPAGSGSSPPSSTGQNSCFGGPNGPAIVPGGPCTDLFLADANGVAILDANGRPQPKNTEGDGFIHKLSLSYQIDRDHLIYATWSRGFRPGGINRTAIAGPYKPDYLTNYEAGTKTSWFDNKLRVNATAFWEEWKDVQLAALGVNSLTYILNVGAARIRGIEGDVTLQAMDNLSLSVSGAYTDARLKNDYFGKNAYTGKPGVLAPAGQQLPVTPPVKLNAIARYTFPLGEYKGHLQGALVYSESSWADLRTNERNTIGKQGAYELVDFTTGIENDRLTFEIYVKNAFNGRGDIYRYPECPAQVCGAQTYRVVYTPRTIGVRLGQKF